MEKKKLWRMVCIGLAVILLYSYPALLGEELGDDWTIKDGLHMLSPLSLDGEKIPPEEEPLIAAQIRGETTLQFRYAEPEIWRVTYGGEDYLLTAETGMLFLPDWEGREEPFLRLTDQQEPHTGLSMFGTIQEGGSLYYVQGREHRRLCLWGLFHSPATFFPTTYRLGYRKFDFATGEISEVTKVEYMARYDRLWENWKKLKIIWQKPQGIDSGTGVGKPVFILSPRANAKKSRPRFLLAGRHSFPGICHIDIR